MSKNVLTWGNPRKLHSKVAGVQVEKMELMALFCFQDLVIRRLAACERNIVSLYTCRQSREEKQSRWVIGDCQTVLSNPAYKDRQTTHQLLKPEWGSNPRPLDYEWHICCPWHTMAHSVRTSSVNSPYSHIQCIFQVYLWLHISQAKIIAFRLLHKVMIKTNNL